MEYVALVFGILGFVAYLEVFSLKRRVEKLESALSKTEGTDYYETRRSLGEAAKSCIGEPVILELKEDHEDADIHSYGNTKHGSNTILDVDDDWMRIVIDTPKGRKEKLIRLESVLRISRKPNKI